MKLSSFAFEFSGKTQKNVGICVLPNFKISLIEKQSIQFKCNAPLQMQICIETDSAFIYFQFN